MADAPPGAASKAKTSKSGAVEAGDGKKRFEVKKVRSKSQPRTARGAKWPTVECGSLMGLGYRCGQLCYLP